LAPLLDEATFEPQRRAQDVQIHALHDAAGALADERDVFRTRLAEHEVWVKQAQDHIEELRREQEGVREAARLMKRELVRTTARNASLEQERDHIIGLARAVTGGDTAALLDEVLYLREELQRLRGVGPS
jgi:predicted metal-dependent hydrolase